jgi:hypothetical protein
MAASTKAANRLGIQRRAEQTDCYRVILFNGVGTAVLLRKQSDKYSLPEIHIPKFRRPAEEITTALRKHWGAATVLLFSKFFESGQGISYYAALEGGQERLQAPAGMAWFPVHDAVSSLLESGDGHLLNSTRERIRGSAEPGPFSRLGWMRRLQEWIRTILGPEGIQIREFQQLNGGGTFCLVRFETTHKPVWFKAVGEPNLREFPITLLLSELFPTYLPSILAADPVLNGWLMKSGGEVTLRGVECADTWRGASRRLADLQIESIERTGRLLNTGCRDMRIETLASMTAPFFEAMMRLMESQTKIPPAPLTRKELLELASKTKEALHLFSELGVPDTLGHGDFNPGNILVDGRRCVFTDWADAHVGHPFLTFEYFLAHLRKSRPVVAIQEAELREAYRQRWVSTISTGSIDRALQLSPLIAVYAYAVANGAWRESKRLSVPGIAAYLRSLTRIMNQEARSLCRTGRSRLKPANSLPSSANQRL